MIPSPVGSVSVAFCLAMASTGLATTALAQDLSLWLYNREDVAVGGYFAAGETVYGSCDIDCLDLDLFLLDGVTGNVVSEDTALDSFPYVVAPYDGNFVLLVTMPNCTHPEGCAVWLSSDYGFAQPRIAQPPNRPSHHNQISPARSQQMLNQGQHLLERLESGDDLGNCLASSDPDDC